MIHSLRTTSCKVGKNNIVTIKNVSNRVGRRGFMPEIPDSILEPLNRFWCCLRSGVKNKHFREEQYHKHCSLFPLSGGQNYWVEGRIGRKYVERGRKYDIIEILNRNGYKFGGVYKCRKLVLDLEKELKCSVRVRFKEIDGARYLDEICLLYSLGLKRFRYKQSHAFGVNDEFVLEDFPQRIGVKKNQEKNQTASLKMHSIGMRLRCYKRHQ